MERRLIRAIPVVLTQQQMVAPSLFTFVQRMLLVINSLEKVCDLYAKH